MSTPTHVTAQETHGAQRYAEAMASVAREAQGAVAERRADLAAAERAARVAESAADAARQEAQAAQGVQDAAREAINAEDPATPTP